MTRALLRPRALLCAAIAAGFLLLCLLTAFQKDLVRTLSYQGFGRYQFSIAAALTQQKYGIGGFVATDAVWSELMRGGISDNPRELEPLGRVFPDNLRDGELLQKALDRASNLVAPPPENVVNPQGYFSGLTGVNAQDAGLTVYTLISFKLFGLSLASLTYMYFLIGAVSLAIFFIGHARNGPALVAVTLLMMAAYLLTSSNLVSSEWIDFKDPRYMSTLAAIPALHVLFFWSGRRSLTLFDYIFLALQLTILAFTIQMRSSALWVVIALLGGWLFFVIRALRSGRAGIGDMPMPRAQFSVFVPGAVVAFVSAGFLAISMTAHPLYKSHGDIPHHTLWHGILYSLQLHPDWTAKYGSLAGGAEEDAMPVVAAKLAIEKLPPDERKQYLTIHGWPTRAALERFSRLIFFDILSKDPGFVAETFFVIKPVRMVTTSLRFMASMVQSVSIVQLSIAIAAIIVLLVVAAGDAPAFGTAAGLPLIAVAFALTSWIPNWLVALSNVVMIDHFLWVLFALCAAVFAVAHGLIGRLRLAALRPR